VIRVFRTPANVGPQADVGVRAKPLIFNPDFVIFVVLGLVRRRRNE